MILVNEPKRYMNLMVDYAFKQLFGQPQGADLLVAFLNAVLKREGADRIVQVEFQNTEFPSKDVQDKTVRLDILVRTNTDEWIDVEVQVAPQKSLVKRSLLYWARVYDGQTERGVDYGVLRPTIVIQILDFVFVHSTERFHTSYHVTEDQDGFRLSSELELHLIEMPKFRRAFRNTSDALRDPLQRWLLFLDADQNPAIREELEVLAMSDPTMEKAFNLWEAVSKDPENWAAYINRDMAIRDLNQMKREAREEGLEEGKLEGKLETAKAMLEDGLNVARVSRLTGIPIEELERLQEEHH
ncbi:MAG: Rpn family recombination-promoting nuclease/putative transposase [Bacilli bacterium]